jgi:hypothetical protein
MWVAKNKDQVSFYQKSGGQVEGNFLNSHMPFTINIQTKWQKQMLLQHGHESGVSIDATFGINDKKVWNSTSST